jgi:hypothetical protein
LDAIVYPSAQHVGGRDIVIFVSQDDLDPGPHEWGGDHTPMLKINQASILLVEEI